MGAHPFREPLGAAFIVAKGTVGGVPDQAHQVLPHIAEFRDLFARKEEIGMIHGELKKLFLIELHGVLLSWGNGMVVVGKHAGQRHDALIAVDFGKVRQRHELAGGEQQANETAIR
jgi:hypothetical protein